MLSAAQTLQKKPKPNFRRVFGCSLLLAYGCVFWTLVISVGSEATAQELKAQRSPLTAWLDLRAVPLGTSSAQSVPAWVESLECSTQKSPLNQGSGSVQSGLTGLPIVNFHSETGPLNTSDRVAKKTEENYPQKTVFRIRLARPDPANDDLQMRILFDDRPGAIPLRVTAWDELGAEMMRSAPLGQGLDLPSSETIIVPMRGVNYLEITASGDGSQVHGAFLTWLKRSRIRQSADFPSENSVREPFHILSAVRPRQDDAFLYGVVTAGLQSAPIKLKLPEAPSTTLQFELEKQPLVAVVTFEVLGATIFSPPMLSVNGHALGVSELFLPDLADPAYRGEAREMDSQMTFRYAGWLRGQKVIPGTWLVGGLNNLLVELSNGSDPLAVRAVEIQLKYPWEKLDYSLSPAPAPFPAP